MTFSVVARDPGTGELGIAVSSCILAVGRAVPSARPGVGVVAVQARSRRGLGLSLLAGLADGADPAGLVRAAAHAAEDEEFVEPGEITPEDVHPPGVFVDRVVVVGPEGKGVEKRTTRPRGDTPETAAAAGEEVGPETAGDHRSAA